MKQIIRAAALALASMTFSTSALAQAAPPGLLVTIDENGHGTVSIAGAAAVPLAYALLPDAGPGGLSSVLTYVYPFTYVPGDVLLLDADEGNAFLDVLRFNPGTIAFYSDNLGGADDLADTASPPGEFYTNLVRIPEVGPEGDNGAFYTPTANQPGYVAGFAATYHFISDAPAVPEPSTWAMMLAGFGAVGVALRRRRRKSVALA